MNEWTDSEKSSKRLILCQNIPHVFLFGINVYPLINAYHEPRGFISEKSEEQK